MKENILVLGGSWLQLPLIKKLIQKEKYNVFFGDFTENPIAKRYCENHLKVDIFSVEEVLQASQQNNIKKIFTIGTDQPVYTAAKVCETLNIAYPITSAQALLATDKTVMKKFFDEANIPTSKYFEVNMEEIKDIITYLNKLQFPIVIKPSDSQGQRGIYKVEKQNIDDISKKMLSAKKYTRNNKIIIEEFNQGTEISCNCWIEEGEVYNLITTDRIHYSDDIALGICKQHRYPSQSFIKFEKKILEIIKKIINKSKIMNGPLYIQMIVNEQEINVIEFAFRVGGGNEYKIIDAVFGIDFIDLYINLISKENKIFKPELLDKPLKSHASICFLLPKKGVVNTISLSENVEINVEKGKVLNDIFNATSRIGHFLVAGESLEEYQKNLTEIEDSIVLLDKNKRVLFEKGIWS